MLGRPARWRWEWRARRHLLFVRNECFGLRASLRRLRRQTDLRDAGAAEDIEHIHDGLVLAGTVTADDDGDVQSDPLAGFDPDATS